MAEDDRASKALLRTGELAGFESSSLPREFFCPITREVMRNPVVAQDGHTYECHAIAQWFLDGKRSSPSTGEALPGLEVIPNRALRAQITTEEDRASPALLCTEERAPTVVSL